MHVNPSEPKSTQSNPSSDENVRVFAKEIQIETLNIPGVVNKGVGLCTEAVPVRNRSKGGWELKDSSPFVRLPMKVCP